MNLNNKYEKFRWGTNLVTNDKESYKIQQGNHDVKIAIIDSGIDPNHPDLKANLIYSKSYSSDHSIDDILGHGTMVAGEIAANGNLKGIAPNIAIASYKVFDSKSCNSIHVIQAIIDAVNDKMDIINLSLGTTKSLQKESDINIINSYITAIKYAISRNCLIVSASGTSKNGFDISTPFFLNNDPKIFLPGGLDNVITVGATDRNNNIEYYSNYGDNVDIFAPSGDYGPNWFDKGIADLRYTALVTCPINFKQSKLSLLKEFDKGYDFTLGGTSLSTPKVSGALGLLICQYQNTYGFKPDISTLKSLLYKGTIPLNTEFSYGKGILNIFNSLKLI